MSSTRLLLIFRCFPLTCYRLIFRSVGHQQCLFSTQTTIYGWSYSNPLASWLLFKLGRMIPLVRCRVLNEQVLFEMFPDLPDETLSSVWRRCNSDFSAAVDEALTISSLQDLGAGNGERVRKGCFRRCSPSPVPPRDDPLDDCAGWGARHDLLTASRARQQLSALYWDPIQCVNRLVFRSSNTCLEIDRSYQEVHQPACKFHACVARERCRLLVNTCGRAAV